MEIGFAFDSADRKTVPPRLRHIDVHGDLPQAALDHEPLEKFRLLEQRLAVRHQHRNGADRNGITNDLDQFVRPARAPVGVGHVAAGDLQSAARSLEAAVGVDLFLHLRERRDRNRVRVFRQVTMRAMKRAIARAEGEAAMREMPPGDLIIRAQFRRKRVPALLQDARFFFGDGTAKSVPARPPALRSVQSSVLPVPVR